MKNSQVFKSCPFVVDFDNGDFLRLWRPREEGYIWLNPFTSVVLCVDFSLCCGCRYTAGNYDHTEGMCGLQLNTLTGRPGVWVAMSG